jgi:hypothetical protein
MNNNSERIEIGCIYKSMSPQAVLIDDGARTAWIPISTMTVRDIDKVQLAEPGDSLTLFIPEWLAKKKGLI